MNNCNKVASKYNITDTHTNASMLHLDVLKIYILCEKD